MSSSCVDLLDMENPAGEKRYDIKSFAFVCDGVKTSTPAELDGAHQEEQSACGGLYQRYIGEGCASNQQQLLLQPDTCLDLQEHNSLYLDGHPVCQDGSSPEFTWYSQRNCKANNKLPFALDPATDHCLGVRKAGSMKWVCSSPPPSPQTPSNQPVHPANPGEAEAFTLPNSDLHPQESSGPVSGRFQRFSASETCREPRMPLFLQPDKCLVISSSRPKLVLGSAATCANGTEARLEIYEGDDCWDGEVTQRSEAEDVVGTCLDLAKEGSVAWVCEGVPQEEGRERKGRKKEGKQGKDGLGTGAWVGIVFGVLGVVVLVGGVVVAVHRPTWEAVRVGRCTVLVFAWMLTMRQKYFQPGYGPISLQ